MLLEQGKESFSMKIPSNENSAIQYEESLKNFTRLKEEVLFVLQDSLEKAGIKIHAIHSRVKTLKSVADKLARIEQGGGKSPSLETIDDLVGLRIVCLFLSDIPRIADVLRSSFNVLIEDNKIDGADITSFGYQSVHFISQLPQYFSGPRYDQIKSMRFEVQVRTIAMDAWAAASHYLDYKSEVGVPIHLKKDFYALSGLFYVADTHFEMFYNEAQRSRQELRISILSKEALSNKLLDTDTLSEYLSGSLSDRNQVGREGISELLSELLETGYKTVGELDQIMQRGMDAFLAYEKENPPGVRDDEDDDLDPPRRFADVGVVRILLEIADENFLNNRQKEEKFTKESIDKLIKYRSQVKPQ